MLNEFNFLKKILFNCEENKHLFELSSRIFPLKNCLEASSIEKLQENNVINEEKEFYNEEYFRNLYLNIGNTELEKSKQLEGTKERSYDTNNKEFYI